MYSPKARCRCATNRDKHAWRGQRRSLSHAEALLCGSSQPPNLPGPRSLTTVEKGRRIHEMGGGKADGDGDWVFEASCLVVVCSLRRDPRPSRPVPREKGNIRIPLTLAVRLLLNARDGRQFSDMPGIVWTCGRRESLPKGREGLRLGATLGARWRIGIPRAAVTPAQWCQGDGIELAEIFLCPGASSSPSRDAGTDCRNSTSTHPPSSGGKHTPSGLTTMYPYR